MKFVFFALLLIPALSFAQTSKPAFFYCIDHEGKVVYYSTGNAVVKKGLEKPAFYQYGFMKWKGWINKSWQQLEYNLQISPEPIQKQPAVLTSLIKTYQSKGYKIEKVPMPYPMKPYAGYKKDGTN